MMKLLPEHYRVLFVIALMVVLSGFSIYVGWEFGSAQQVTACSNEKKLLQEEIGKLQLKVAALESDKAELKTGLATANHAAELLQAKSDAADQARLAAEQLAADIRKSSDSRIKKLTAAKQASTGCSDMLARYWEMRN